MTALRPKPPSAGVLLRIGEHLVLERGGLPAPEYLAEVARALPEAGPRR